MPTPPATSEAVHAQEWPDDPAPPGHVARLQQQLEEQVQLLTFLSQLDRQLSGTMNLGEIVAQTVELVRRAVGATSGGLVLLDEGKRVRLWAPTGKSPSGEQSTPVLRVILGRMLSSSAAQHWESMLVEDSLKDRYWSSLPASDDEAHRSIIAVPLPFRGRQQGRRLGVLVLTHRKPRQFKESDLELLGVAAARLAEAMVQTSARHSAVEQRTSFQTTVVNLPDAVFVVDAQGRVTLTNPTLDRLVERTAGELLGRDFRQAIVLEHSSQPHPIEQILRGYYTSFDMDMVLHNSDGEGIPVRVSCGAIPNGRGRPSGATVVLRDIRYLKELEGLRQDLTSMLVHDLKAPLTSISSAVQLLQQYPLAQLGEQTLQELLSIAERSSSRLSRMIEAVLDVQRLEAGQFPLATGPVLLQEVVARVMREVSPVVAEAGIHTRLDVPSELPAVSGDKEVLERVLWNLLDNALKYTPQNGSIAVTAKVLALPDGGPPGVPKDLPPGLWILVEVTDSGVGIPAEERERIFGKFTQGRRGPVRRRGVGLGLAFCRLAVEAHGGRIWVEGQHGKGSAFSFVLPVAPADAEEP